MTPVPIARPGPADWVPVDDCTLPTAEQPLRGAEFDALFAAALRTVEHPAGAPTRARLVLAGDTDLPGRVQRLADAETACCSFFAFTVTTMDADRSGSGSDLVTVALDVAVPATRTDVLEALAARGRRVLR